MTAPGPYIVIHRHLPEHDGATGWERKCALATLDEEEVYRALYTTPLADKLGVARLIAEVPDVRRRSISLPDGSEIVVEATTWRRIASNVYRRPVQLEIGPSTRMKHELLVAYSARFGTAAQEATS
jgi:hypothetical protein